MEEGEIALEILKFFVTEMPGEFNVNIMWRVGEISRWTGIPYEELKKFLEKISEKGEEIRKKESERYLKEIIYQRK